MSAKHTPGPWSVTEGSSDGRTVLAVVPADRDGFAVCLISPIRNVRSLDRPNAHLIAAAPELLDALRQVVDEKVDYMLINHLGDPEVQHTIKAARAAIAKAEGGAS